MIRSRSLRGEIVAGMWATNVSAFPGGIVEGIENERGPFEKNLFKALGLPALDLNTF